MARRYEGKIQLIGMAGLDTPDAMQAFVQKYGLQDMPQAVSEDGSLWEMFGVPAQPAWVLIDDSGQADAYLGPQAEDRLEALFDGLIER